MAILAAYIAGLCDHAEALAPGERALLLILSKTAWQATKALQYLRGIFTEVSAFKALVEGETADTISLTNRVDIECVAASFRNIRGGTCIAILCDEVALWLSDNSANPDKEILAAARPMLMTTGGPLVVISSPYARRGELWAAYKRDYGAKGDPLIVVAHAPSRVMNPMMNCASCGRAPSPLRLATRGGR